MPSHSEAPSGGARAFGYFGLFKVTRRKGVTPSRPYRHNGYAPNFQTFVGIPYLRKR